MNRPRLIALLLALATLLLYLPTGWHDFIIYDDGDYVSQNKVVSAGLTWNGVKWAFGAHLSNWHPVTWLSHMLDCQLFGLNPGAHHLVNVLFHVANVLLLFLLVWRLAKDFWPSAIVAALFAWHPLHVESVAWIAERKDVLSTFFGLLALLVYTRYARENARRSFWLAVFLFACSLMSKPMLVTLPFVFLILDFWPLKRASKFQALLLEKWPFFLLTIGSCIVTYFAQRARSVVSLDQLPLAMRLGNAVLSYGKYLLKTIWPADLAIIYPLSTQLTWALVAVVTVFLIVISVCVWTWRRQAPYFLMGWLWFLGTLVPVIGLVQVGRAAMADRYSYVPLIGIFIAVVFGFQTLARRFRFHSVLTGACATIVLCGCLGATAYQLHFWESDELLFGHAIVVTPPNAIAQVNFGAALEKQGLIQEAQEHYHEALRIDPHSVEAHVDVGIFLDNEGKLDEAMAHYREALRLSPDAPLAHMNLGGLLVKLGRFDEAMTHYEASAKYDPTDARPHYLMGKARLRQGRSSEAIAAFYDALRLDANELQTLLWLARVRAADENAGVRNAAEAVAAAERANVLTDMRDPVALDVLAMAYAEAGRFEEAIRVDEAVIQAAEALRAQGAAATTRERLKLYRAGKAYRENFKQP